MKQRIAILDLGSNSIRTTITDCYDDGELKVVASLQEMVRISEGMGKEKILQPQAIQRAILALTKFKNIYNQYKPQKIIAIATAAVRQARNQSEFLQTFQSLLGFPLKVITGEQEAEYDYLGVKHSLPVKNEVIIDTGGASTELILVQNGKMRDRISLPLGAVSITENFLVGDPVTAASLFEASIKISNTLNNLPWLEEANNFPIVAIGGSNRTLAKIMKKRLNQTELPIHGYHMQRHDVDEIFYSLLAKNIKERKNVRGLSSGRAGIIIGGMLPLRVLMQKIDAQQLIFSQSGVREGILFEEVEKRNQKKSTFFSADSIMN